MSFDIVIDIATGHCCTLKLPSAISMFVRDPEPAPELGLAMGEPS